MPETPTESFITGSGNHVSTDAVAGRVADRPHLPQHVPFGLYAEQLSGTAFPAPRREPAVMAISAAPTANHPASTRYAGAPKLISAPFDAVPPSPNRLRWDPLPWPDAATDWLDGLVTYGGNRDVAAQTGVGVHHYAATADMARAFCSADGELLLVPEQGRLAIDTELGRIELASLQVALIPRGAGVLPRSRCRRSERCSGSQITSALGLSWSTD